MLKALAVAPEQIWTGVPIVFHYGQYSVGRFCSFFFLPIIFPLPSFSLLMSFTYLQRNQAHQESLREILHPRPCVPMDNRQRYSKAVFFIHIFHVSHISSLLSSPPLSQKKKPKKKKKQLTKTNGTSGANRPLSQTPPTAIAQTVASKTN